MDRITAIRRSLAAFVCGILSLLPVIGIAAAACALNHSRAIRLKYARQWNPASAYLRAGELLAVLGTLGTILLGLVIALAVADAFG